MTAKEKIIKAKLSNQADQRKPMPCLRPDGKAAHIKADGTAEITTGEAMAAEVTTEVPSDGTVDTSKPIKPKLRPAIKPKLKPCPPMPVKKDDKKLPPKPILKNLPERPLKTRPAEETSVKPTTDTTNTSADTSVQTY